MPFSACVDILGLPETVEEWKGLWKLKCLRIADLEILDGCACVSVSECTHRFLISRECKDYAATSDQRSAIFSCCLLDVPGKAGALAATLAFMVKDLEYERKYSKMIFCIALFECAKHFICIILMQSLEQFNEKSAISFFLVTGESYLTVTWWGWWKNSDWGIASSHLHLLGTVLHQLSEYKAKQQYATILFFFHFIDCSSKLLRVGVHGSSPPCVLTRTLWYRWGQEIVADPGSSRMLCGWAGISTWLVQAQVWFQNHPGCNSLYTFLGENSTECSETHLCIHVPWMVL